MKQLLLLLFALVSLGANAVTVNVGYKCSDDYIYQYDGIGGLEQDARVGAFIRLTPDMLRPYAGAKIKSLRIGWADMDNTSPCELFIRTALDSQKGEVLATGKGTLSYKSSWNVINLDEPLVIGEDIETIYVGYYANVKKNAYAISKVYPINQEGSCYVWRDDLDKDAQGNEIWTDLRDMGALAIQAVVEGTSAQLNNLLEVESMTYFPIQTLGSTSTQGLVHVTNKGANSVTKFTLTYTLNGETHDQVVSCNVGKGQSVNVNIPFYGMGTGKGTVSISKIGTAANRLTSEFPFDMIAVPSDVAKKYKRRPFVEFFESEGEYRVPKYYDEYFMDGYRKHAKNMTLVAHHLNDQFMLGKDEATTMMIDFADGDKMQVSIPAIMVDRTKQAANPAALLNAPYEFIVFEWYADQYVWNPALAVPTFANVNIVPAADGVIDEELGYNNRFNVEGTIEPGVLTDEDLYLTVYMVEDQVETDSQDKPVTYDDKDDKKAPSAAPARKEDDKKDEGYAPGYYVHDNVIRERLTPMYGKKVSVDENGNYSMPFDFTLEDEYKAQDIRFVAVLHRGNEGHDRFHRNVINCCEIKGSDVFGEEYMGISGVLSQQLQNTYFDLQGRSTNANARGVVIKNGKKVLNK